jgi:hypothetical protein
MSVRQVLNTNNLNQLEDALHALPIGELLTKLIKSMTATEAGLVPASNIATMAATPSGLFQVNVTAGTVTGVKTLRRGVITGSGAQVAATGECIWDGATKILFSPIDAATAVSVTYSVATDKASVLEASL